jgi:N-acetylmuramoyl-L-alanine amidase
MIRRSLIICLMFVAGCAMRRGDEIVVDGHFVHTRSRVILWNDPGGFNAYASGGWNQRPAGQQIDQFVIHYDAADSSANCFAVLKSRGLSVHFMIDVDGTIYQTLDVKERAWHATKANNRSIGVEMANLGAFPPDQANVLQLWHMNHPWAQAVVGQVQGKMLRMYDFSPQQYESLIKLTAALCKTLPQIRCDYPRDENGRLITHVLSDQEFQNYHGILGHYHIQIEKVDPGPAFQWDRLIEGVRACLMNHRPRDGA